MCLWNLFKQCSFRSRKSAELVKSESCTINTLPNEILLEIFFAAEPVAVVSAASSYLAAQSSPTLSSWTLFDVCYRWRILARRSKQLWIRVELVLDPPSRWNAQLGRLSGPRNRLITRLIDTLSLSRGDSLDDVKVTLSHHHQDSLDWIGTHSLRRALSLLSLKHVLTLSTTNYGAVNEYFQSDCEKTVSTLETGLNMSSHLRKLYTDLSFFIPYHPLPEKATGTMKQWLRLSLLHLDSELRYETASDEAAILFHAHTMQLVSNTLTCLSIYSLGFTQRITTRVLMPTLSRIVLQDEPTSTDCIISNLDRPFTILDLIACPSLRSLIVLYEHPRSCSVFEFLEYHQSSYGLPDGEPALETLLFGRDFLEGKCWQHLGVTQEWRRLIGSISRCQRLILEGAPPGHPLLQCLARVGPSPGPKIMYLLQKRGDPQGLGIASDQWVEFRHGVWDGDLTGFVDQIELTGDFENKTGLGSSHEVPFHTESVESSFEWKVYTRVRR